MEFANHLLTLRFAEVIRRSLQAVPGKGEDLVDALLPPVHPSELLG